MNHTVQQGEHLSSIAREYGFNDYRPIWNHAQNAALKAARKSPNILLPGDVLFIPPKEAKWVGKSTDSRHQFRVSGQPLSLKVTLNRQFYEPLRSAKGELRVDLNRIPVETSPAGEVDERIPPTLTEATLVLRQTIQARGQTIQLETEFPLRIGHLDPIEEPSGWLVRLANLGYYRGAIDEPGTDELRSAVEEFQCDQGLTVDGVVGPKTKEKLKSVYGC